ncbi:SGNH/GDSL hydrolase family protein [Rhodococcus sp. UNC23MFCrub1.1]|uniref:SGNH/GDSL hydrolase family protein n=1 Tax=Rhodococcus sp. UNC23MFCrub1.1 TaxID=1449068 RepID=UPI000488AB5B|nr:SGNH/GDSL hydrolase family protein [Rhodococcus sp. UNC23MFCrub1.1]
MATIRLITATIASSTALLASCSSAPDVAPTGDGSAPVRSAVFFGDSLTDAGTYGMRFTTNPGRSWAQIVSERLGQSTEPNVHVDDPSQIYVGVPPLTGPGGPNYAQGGARADAAYSTVSDDPNGAPWSTAVQVDRYLSANDSFRDDQLITLFVGTNDVAYHYDTTKSPLGQQLRDNVAVDAATMRIEKDRVESAADAAAATANRIVDNGARHLMVFELYDLSAAPWFRTDAARSYISQLTEAYNARLNAQLDDNPAIELMRTDDFIDTLLTDGSRHGLQHFANEDACREPDQDYCDETGLADPDADRTYVFAGSVHFTTRTNELFADWVLNEAGVA